MFTKLSYVTLPAKRFPIAKDKTHRRQSIDKKKIKVELYVRFIDRKS